MVKKFTAMILTLAMLMTVTSNFAGVLAANDDPIGTVALKFYKDEALTQPVTEPVTKGSYVYGGISVGEFSSVKKITITVGFDTEYLTLEQFAADPSNPDLPVQVELGDGNGSWKAFDDYENGYYGVKQFDDDIDPLENNYYPNSYISSDGDAAVTMSFSKTSGVDMTDETKIAVLKFKTIKTGTTQLSTPCYDVEKTRNDDGISINNNNIRYDYVLGEIENVICQELTIGSKQLASPQGLDFNTDTKVASWQAVQDPDVAGYNVTVIVKENGNEVDRDTYTNVTGTSFPVDVKYGHVTVQVTAVASPSSDVAESRPAVVEDKLVKYQLPNVNSAELVSSGTDTLVRWTAVEGASGYLITLKSDNGDPDKTYTALATSTEYVVTEGIVTPTQGRVTYTATVKAIGSDPYTITSQGEATSNPKSFFGAVGAPTNVKWLDNSYVASWQPGQEAENVSGYIVNLKKGNSVVHPNISVTTGTSVNLESYMTEVGDYTFEVIALGKTTGEGKYLNSQPAPSTNEKTVSKILDVVNITEWNDRIVTWTDGNENTIKLYQVELFKGNETSPIFTELVNAATINFDDYDTNLIGAGEYTVKITSKGDGRYYKDSVEKASMTKSFNARIPEPTNLNWVEKKAVWQDSGTSENGYTVTLWYNGVNTGVSYSTSAKEYDFAQNGDDIDLPGKYVFKVKANPSSTHSGSAEAVSPELEHNDVTRNGKITVAIYEDEACTTAKSAITAGDTFYAGIKLSSSTPYQITNLAMPFKFNPDYLQVEGGEEGVILGDMIKNNNFQLAPNYPYVNNTTGLIALSAYKGSPYTINAEETVMVIKFKAIMKAEQQKIEIAVANADGNPYDETILSGVEFALASTPSFLDEFESATFNIQAGPLPKMDAPVFDGTTLKWTKYASEAINNNVAGYEIQLYKNGQIHGTPITVNGVDTLSTSMGAYMTAEGAYYAVIKALSNNTSVALDGAEYSDPSNTYTVSYGGGGGSSTPKPTPTPSPEPTVEPFIDIDGHWAEDSINELQKYNVIEGYGDRTFRPDWGITRAEFTKMMVVALGLEVKEATENIYLDTKDHWSRDYVAVATKEGIVNGIGEDMFAPDVIISREQISAIIWRIAGRLEVANDSTYKDKEDVSPYAQNAVEYVTDKGYMIGFTDNTFKPTDKTNRAQAATVILRLIKSDFFKNIK